MISLSQILVVFVIPLSILLFFAPIVMLIGLIGDMELGPIKINLSGRRPSMRILIALLGLGSWFLLYIPLISLAFRSILPPATTAPTGWTISMLGQDGTDLAVSGCPNGTLGPRGVIDNHIRILGIQQLDNLKQIDLYADNPGLRSHPAYPYLAGHWQFPCTYGWKIETQITNTDQLDLYFESSTQDSLPVTYTIVLQFSNGTQTQLSVDGFTGICCTE